MFAEIVENSDGSIPVISAETARSLTDKIRAGFEGIYQLIVQAYRGRAWVSLGYRSWDDYIRREFGNLPLRPPLEDREEIVQSLRSAGMSNRAIAVATDLGETTVRRAIVRSGAPNGASEQRESPIVGQDGKEYRSVASHRKRVGHVQQLHDQGKSVRDIAAETGLSVGSVHGDLRKIAGPRADDLEAILDAPATGFGIAVLDSDDRVQRKNKHVEQILNKFHIGETAVLKKAMFLAEKVGGFVSPVTAALDMGDESYTHVSQDLAAAIRQFSHVVKTLAGAQAGFQSPQVLRAVLEDLRRAGDDLADAIARMEAK